MTKLDKQESILQYTNLKTDLRNKIIQLQKNIKNEILIITGDYLQRKALDEKKIQEFFEKKEREGDAFDDLKQYAELTEILNLQLAYRTFSNWSCLVLESTIQHQKRIQRELIKTFRRENSVTIEEYKKMGSDVRSDIDFHEMSRYARDKENIEKQINSVWEWKVEINDVIQHCGLWKTTIEIILEYFNWWNTSELAKKLNITPKRLRQIRSRWIVKMVSKTMSWDLA